MGYLMLVLTNTLTICIRFTSIHAIGDRERGLLGRSFNYPRACASEERLRGGRIHLYSCCTVGTLVRFLEIATKIKIANRVFLRGE